MYKVMKNILFNVLGQAVKGRALWKKIIAKNNINLEKDFVILVSKEEQQCSYYTLLYLNKIIEWLELRKNELEKHNIPVIRRNERFLVLTDDPDVLKYAKKISRRVTYVEFMKCEELDNIIKYYSIYPYTDRLLIGMYKDIPGRRGCEALLASKISIEELVANGIFDMKIKKFNKITRPKLPKEIGSDKEFYEFVAKNDLRMKKDGS